MEKIKNKNVLVVDHSEINRLELRELLQGFMNVEEAADIEKAEEILTEGKQHIDIIIQDIVFPQKSGFELLEFLRSHNEYNEIPVMVVSAETSDNFIARSFDLGAADYIRRPFVSSLLLRRISVVAQMYRYRQEQITALDHSFLWLAAQSVIDFIGFRSLSEFTDNCYYIKANLTMNTVVDMSKMTKDAIYPDSYTSFTEKFIDIIAGGYDAEQVRLDLDRSRLLEQFQKRRFFINKSYELNNKDGKILRLAAYCQLLLVNNEVFAAVLAINLSTLYDKAAVSKHDLAFDTVSGMFGRNYGERVCTEFLQYHPSIYAAVVSVNIRNFDVMNRHFGKRVGDMIISSLSAQLSDEVGSNCLITRSGSGRFSMLMEVEKEDVIISLLNALSQKERCIIDNEKKLGYKLSFGYSIYPDDSREYSELARMAEMALDYSDMHPNQPFFRFSDEIMLKSGSRHGFNIMDIANGIPGAILVYRADGNEEILYANNETIRLFECNDFDDFMQHVNGSFKGFVYKEDLDRVESTIWNQLNETNENRIDYVEYRIVTKNGLIREVDDIGRLIDSPYYGRIFYVFIHDMTTKESVLQNSLSHTSAVQAKFSQSSNNGGGK